MGGKAVRITPGLEGREKLFIIMTNTYNQQCLHDIKHWIFLPFFGCHIHKAPQN